MTADVVGRAQDASPLRPVRAVWLVIAAVCGCASLPPLQPLIDPFLPPQRSYSVEDFRDHQQRFQVDRDPESLNWLLAHTVQSGMSVAAVEAALGETGQRYDDARELRSNAGHYQETDVAFQWGPDTGGRSIILFFREGKLVNFEPEEFLSP